MNIADSPVQGVGTTHSVLALLPEAPPELAIVTTDRCQAHCAHCLMKSGPEETAQVKISDIRVAVDWMSAAGALKLVVFTGGESTLLESELFEAISYCSDRGIATRLVTNAHWAEDADSANSMVSALVEAGLNEINFSTDDFHAVWIPLERIRFAWHATKEKGLATVLVATCSGPASRITAESVRDYLGENVPILDPGEGCSGDRIRDGKATFYGISRSRISRLGRGNRLKASYFPREAEQPPYGGCDFLGRPMTMTADGAMGACCGVNTRDNPILSLGALTTSGTSVNTLETTLEQYSLLKAIRVLGPTELYRMANDALGRDVEMLGLSEICEVCERLTGDPQVVSWLYSNTAEIQARTQAAILARELNTVI